MFNPCYEHCYLKYGTQYTKACDNLCDYARVCLENKKLNTTHEKVWLVHKVDHYKDCKDENGYPDRRNFPEVTIEEVNYNSPLDLALKLNSINDLANRLNKDYVYTDYDLAVKEANMLKRGD